MEDQYTFNSLRDEESYVDAALKLATGDHPVVTIEVEGRQHVYIKTSTFTWIRKMMDSKDINCGLAKQWGYTPECWIRVHSNWEGAVDARDKAHEIAALEVAVSVVVR
jgi:hypothetical protein